MQRTVFFISDGTAITTETLGHSLLTQFPGVTFRQVRIPFVGTPEKAAEAVLRIDAAGAEDGAAAIVFLSVIDDATRAVFYHSTAIVLDLFADFLDTLEGALGIAPEASVGRAHGLADNERYEDRIEATNYALAHDDGVSLSYEKADLVLVGISRTGKTPTCLYMALHFGVKAANYPLTQEDLERQRLPDHLRHGVLRGWFPAPRGGRVRRWKQRRRRRLRDHLQDRTVRQRHCGSGGSLRSPSWQHRLRRRLQRRLPLERVLRQRLPGRHRRRVLRRRKPQEPRRLLQPVHLGDTALDRHLRPLGVPQRPRHGLRLPSRSDGALRRHG